MSQKVRAQLSFAKFCEIQAVSFRAILPRPKPHAGLLGSVVDNQVRLVVINALQSYEFAF